MALGTVTTIPPCKRPCITAKFLYFGLRFCCTTATIRQECNVLQFELLQELVCDSDLESCDKFIMEIKNDLSLLSKVFIGGKSDYKSGSFKLLDSPKHIYVYLHKVHASCSQVSLSQLDVVWRVIVEYKWLGKDWKCNHCNHFRLLPFFYDNRSLKCLFDERNAQSLLDELNDAEKTREQNVDCESEFWQPNARVNNWNEDDWSKRLQVGIKKTFEIDTVFTARATFREFVDILKVPHIDTFLFRGYPDILIKHRSAVLVGGKRTVVGGKEAGDDAQKEAGALNSSSEEESLVENSWQRNPLKGFTEDSLPEKLGEVMTGLYILVVSKIIRRLQQGKNIHRQFQAKGALLDKASAANGLCTMSLDFREDVAVPNFRVTDIMGCNLSTELLCYVIQSLTCKE